MFWNRYVAAQVLAVGCFLVISELDALARGGCESAFLYPPSASVYVTGDAPESVSIGDFNGDGAPDLVVANSATNDVSVLLGTGDGTFLGEQRFNAGVQPAFVSIGDLNDDGILDLAVANRGSVGSGAFDGVSILLGNGDGTFQNRKGVNAGASPIALSIGDLDGDGTPDLVVANLNSDDVSVLIGKGDGTFHAEGHFSVGDSPVALSIDDMNGDEALDLVVASSATDTIGVLLGNGDGTFQPMISVTVGGYPSGLSTGD